MIYIGLSCCIIDGKSLAKVDLYFFFSLFISKFVIMQNDDA